MKQENVDKIIEESRCSFEKIVQNAYNKGYEDAKLEFVKEINVDDVIYVDLGLPSGTLWSFPLIKFNYGYQMKTFSFDDVKELNLPTKEQWEELCEHCRFIDNLKIIGPNGKRLGYATAPNAPGNQYIVFSPGENINTCAGYFWLKAEPDAKHMVDVIVYNKNIHGISSQYTGCLLPCFLVRKM